MWSITDVPCSKILPLALTSPLVSTLPNEPVDTDEPLIFTLSLSTVNILILPELIVKAFWSLEFKSTVF